MERSYEFTVNGTTRKVSAAPHRRCSTRCAIA